MAVSRAENVVVMNADGDTVASPLTTSGIKIVAAGAATARLRVDSGSGEVMWESVQSGAGEQFEQIKLISKQTAYLELTGSATVYIYTK